MSAPRLPDAPESYNLGYMSRLLASLRTHFTQLESVRHINVATQNFSLATLPTASAGLRDGDVWVDGNILKVAGLAGGGGSVTTTNSVTFNNGGAGAASGTSFNGASAVTVSYNTVGAAAASHTHAWGDITGTPTTLSGYGLTTDFNTQGDARWLLLSGGTLTGRLGVNAQAIASDAIAVVQGNHAGAWAQTWYNNDTAKYLFVQVEAAQSNLAASHALNISTGGNVRIAISSGGVSTFNQYASFGSGLLNVGVNSAVTTSGWTQQLNLGVGGVVVMDTGVVGTGRYAAFGATSDGNFYFFRSEKNDATTAPDYAFRVTNTGDLDVYGALTVNSVAVLTANQSITLSGDISGTGATAITTAIGANKVTNAMLAQVATATFKGRTTAATGNVEDLTVTQATAMLNTFTTTLKGLAPASGGGTTNFLRADGTWAAPAGGTNISYTASTRAVASSTGTGFTFPLFTSTEAGLAPLSGGGTTNFLRADGTWAAPSGGSFLPLTGGTLTGQLLISGVAHAIKSNTGTRGGGNNYFTFYDSTGEKGYLGYGAADDRFYVWNTTNERITFGTNGTLRMTIGAAGNVVLGAGTASAWNTGYFGVQFGGGGDGLMSPTSATGNLWLYSNSYYTSTPDWKSIATAAGWRMMLSSANDGFSIGRAPSVTAGSTQTFVDWLGISSAGTTTAYGAFVSASSITCNSGNIVASAGRMSAQYNSQTGYSSSAFEAYSSSGNVIITWHAGGSSADYIKHVRGANGLHVYTSGDAYTLLYASDFQIPSDIRLKDDVRGFDDPLAIVRALHGRRFRLKAQNKQSVGFIAQEFQEVLPELVKEAEGLLSINYAPLTAVHNEAIKQLEARIAALEMRH